jgi:hypothetical protein
MKDHDALRQEGRLSTLMSIRVVLVGMAIVLGAAGFVLLVVRAIS